MKISYPERVNTWRLTVQILTFGKGSLQNLLIFEEAINNVQMLQLFSYFEGAFTSKKISPLLAWHPGTNVIKRFASVIYECL
jgi:hypothetical protein